MMHSKHSVSCRLRNDQNQNVESFYGLDPICKFLIKTGNFYVFHLPRMAVMSFSCRAISGCRCLFCHVNHGGGVAHNADINRGVPGEYGRHAGNIRFWFPPRRPKRRVLKDVYLFSSAVEVNVFAERGGGLTSPPLVVKIIEPQGR